MDAIFNPSTSTGWLVTILKTRRTRNKQTKPKKPEEVSTTVLDPEYTQAHVESDILYLKQTPYTKDTEEEIKLKLKRTVKHRQLLLTDGNSNMLANFPYLFVHSELVISFFLIVCS